VALYAADERREVFLSLKFYWEACTK